MQEINNEPFVAWVAPDGTVQLPTIAPNHDFCIGYTNMMAAKGLGKSYSEMRKEGFSIMPILLTVKDATS